MESASSEEGGVPAASAVAPDPVPAERGPEGAGAPPAGFTLAESWWEPAYQDVVRRWIELSRAERRR